MTQTIDVTLNRLPVKTWNWLGMNESRVSLPQIEGGAMKIRLPSGVFYQKRTGEREDRLGWDVLEGGEPTSLGDQILISPHSHPESPIYLAQDYEPGQRVRHQVDIHAGANSEADVVFDLSSTGDQEGVVVLQVYATVEPGATLRIFQLQRLGQGVIHLSDLSGVCGEGATLRTLQLELGGGAVYAGGTVDLEGSESLLEADLGYWGRGNQQIDLNYVVQHRGRKSESKLKASGILSDKSRKLLRGTIDFLPGAAGAKGEEEESVLLLGDHVVNQTIPLILCGEEDVQGNHGASIGRLDEETLFYFGARGIPPQQAEHLLAHSRMEALYRQIPHEETAAHGAEFLEQVVQQ